MKCNICEESNDNCNNYCSKDGNTLESIKISYKLNHTMKNQCNICGLEKTSVENYCKNCGNILAYLEK